MRRARSGFAIVVPAVLAGALALLAPSSLVAQKPPAIAQFLSPPYPFGLVSARKTDRLAWLAYEEGRRNVYTAAAPGFVPVRLTAFTNDDGTDISDLRLADNGSIAVFVRGTAPNARSGPRAPCRRPARAARAVDRRHRPLEQLPHAARSGASRKARRRYWRPTEAACCSSGMARFIARSSPARRRRRRRLSIAVRKSSSTRAARAAIRRGRPMAHASPSSARASITASLASTTSPPAR